ncbi:MAG: hypothetical protein V3U54_13205 [Thermodesulfobacteriota bacterium]
MSYCKICGDRDSPRAPKYPRYCIHCGIAGYIKHCAICNRLVDENGDGFSYHPSEEQIKDLLILKIPHYPEKDEKGNVTGVDLWMCFEPLSRLKGNRCYNRYFENESAPVDDHVQLIIDLKKKGTNQQLLDSLENEIFGGDILSPTGDKVEADSEDSVLRKFGLI